MADLVTHAALAMLLVRAGGAGRGGMSLAAAGAALPDVMGRAPGLALRLVGIESVPFAAWLDVSHTPAGSLVLATLLAQAFERRGRAWALLLLGIGSHFALDVLQFHHGMGYRLLFPLYGARFELGWMGAEATTVMAIPCAVLALAAWMRPGMAKPDE